MPLIEKGVKVFVFENNAVVEKDTSVLSKVPVAVILDHDRRTIIFWMEGENVPSRARIVLVTHVRNLHIQRPSYRYEERTGRESIKEYLATAKPQFPAGKVIIEADGERFEFLLSSEFSEKLYNASSRKITVTLKDKTFSAELGDK